MTHSRVRKVQDKHETSMFPKALIKKNDTDIEKKDKGATTGSSTVTLHFSNFSVISSVGYMFLWQEPHPFFKGLNLYPVVGKVSS